MSMVSGGSLTRVQSWDIITSKDRVQHMGYCVLVTVVKLMFCIRVIMPVMVMVSIRVMDDGHHRLVMVLVSIRVMGDDHHRLVMVIRGMGDGPHRLVMVMVMVSFNGCYGDDYHWVTESSGHTVTSGSP